MTAGDTVAAADPGRGRRLRLLAIAVALAAIFAWRPPLVRAPQTGPPPVWRDRFTGIQFVLLGPGTFTCADAIRLFDCWVGVLTVSDYREFVAPYSARVLAAAGVPTIHFGTGTTPQLLAEMAQAGGTAVGVDWRIRLDEAWTAVGEGRAVQGNLEPAVLLGPWERAEAAAFDVLRRAGGRPATSSTSVTAPSRRPTPLS